MQLFYSPDLVDIQTTHTFTREESKHIIKVLRKTTGDTITLTNGKGAFFHGAITNANPNKCTILVEKIEHIDKHNYYLHLAVAPTKLNDRFEWFLEKATEIGVDEITPILCEHSERKTIKLDRYNRIIESAMKQSLKSHFPKLNELTLFSDFVASKFDNTLIKCIAHCEESEKKSLKELLKTESNTLIIIGPEGDFSSSEIKLASENNFVAITLGRSRLRTETAAIAACHSVAFMNNT